jgi:transcriptional regulator with XRE-family HTH domain
LVLEQGDSVDGIGERLKEERLRNGWSQKDLAQESKTNVDTISGIETGQHEPRPSTLRKLAKALNVEVRDLFEEPALSGKAEAPSPGPSPIVNLALEAARRQAVLTQQTLTRLTTSGVQQDEDMRPLNEAFRNLLEHNYGDVAEAVINLARDYIELEQETAQLREQVAALQEERQRAYQE